MIENLTSALVGGFFTLAGVLISSVVNIIVESVKRKSELQQKEVSERRLVLKDIYEELAMVLEQYPNTSPSDILKAIDFPPNYSGECFSAVISTLNYQIEDFRDKLKIGNKIGDEKASIEIQISNREYCIKEITRNEAEYNKAKQKYEAFRYNTKPKFDLYASQNVKNALVVFNCVIDNVFQAGYLVNHTENNNTFNSIDKARNTVLNSMQQDLEFKNKH